MKVPDFVDPVHGVSALERPQGTAPSRKSPAGMDERESPGAFLRRLAQNDYMIDRYYLPDGQRLLMLAESFDAYEADVAELARARHELSEHRQMLDTARAELIRYGDRTKELRQEVKELRRELAVLDPNGRDHT